MGKNSKKYPQEGYALITAASSGIGKEIAKIFAQNKCNIIIVSRREEKLNHLKTELEKKYNIKVIVIAKDLTNMQNIDDIYSELEKSHINVDFLINNAGFSAWGKLIDNDWETYSKMIELNIKALTKLCYFFAKPMVSRGFGKIWNISSTGSYAPCPNMATYCASKSYVWSFSIALAYELKKTGVSVTSISPDVTETEFNEVANSKEVNMLKGKSATAEQVAKYAYKNMMQGSLTKIHGLQNKIMMTLSNFIPIKIKTRMVGFLMKK